MSEFTDNTTSRIRELGLNMRENLTVLLSVGALALALTAENAGAEKSGSGRPGLDGKGNYCKVFGVVLEPFRRRGGSRAVELRGLGICQPVHQVGGVNPLDVNRDYRWKIDVASGEGTRHIKRSGGPATVIVLPEQGAVELSGSFKMSYGSIVSDEKSFDEIVPRIEDLSRNVTIPLPKYK